MFYKMCSTVVLKVMKCHIRPIYSSCFPFTRSVLQTNARTCRLTNTITYIDITELKHFRKKSCII